MKINNKIIVISMGVLILSDELNNDKKALLIKDYLINLESLFKKEQNNNRILNKCLDENLAKIDDLNNEINELNQSIKQKEEVINNINLDFEDIKSKYDNLSDEVFVKNQKLTELTAENQKLSSLLEDHENKINELDKDLENAYKENNILKNKIDDFSSSNSWKLTAPLRKIGNIFR